MWWFSCCSVDVGQKDAIVKNPQTLQPITTRCPDASGPGPRSSAPEASATPAAPVPALCTAEVSRPLGLSKGRSSEKLDSCDAASVASSQKASTRSGLSQASCCSVGSDVLNSQIPAHQRHVAQVQSQMKTFVKGMVRGREMTALSLDGQLHSCVCSFDRKLRHYNIAINRETRMIPLSKFREVFQGTEPDDIATPLDELCSTLVLDTGECLTFRFKAVKEMENFAMCLQVIVDGHH